MRLDLKIIADIIEPNSKILDIGCGDGTLLEHLKNDKKISGRGLEINPKLVSKALKKGLSVVQGDADNDLEHYPANAFDYVILSQTLQTTKHPDLVLKSLQRISKYALISVPNFAYCENRLYLALKGKMPVTNTLSYEWYNTPNIHFCTLKDFTKLCRELNFSVEKQVFINESLPFCKNFQNQYIANFLAKHGVFLLCRGITIDDKNKSYLNINKAAACT